mgnify:FL=1
MAVPAYEAIYDVAISGPYWKKIAIAVANAQRTTLAKPTPSAAEIAWCKRDVTDEARRITYLVLGTAPVVSKLDVPGSITDAEFDTAMTNLLPNLLKGVL